MQIGLVKYMRRTFDCISDYPAPENGETITDWIDRLHSMNISVNSCELLEWFWPHATIHMDTSEQRELHCRLPDLKFFRWGAMAFTSNEEDLMLLKLSAEPGAVGTLRKPNRTKE
jgi:hypothetical protein